MMAAYILKPIVGYVAKDGAVMSGYMRASRWCLLGAQRVCHRRVGVVVMRLVDVDGVGLQAAQ